MLLWRLSLRTSVNCVMFGDDTSKLSGNIIKNVAQVSEGLSESLGIDVKTLLTGFLGGKLADSSNKE